MHAPTPRFYVCHLAEDSGTKPSLGLPRTWLSLPNPDMPSGFTTFNHSISAPLPICECSNPISKYPHKSLLICQSYPHFPNSNISPGPSPRNLQSLHCAAAQGVLEGCVQLWNQLPSTMLWDIAFKNKNSNK